MSGCPCWVSSHALGHGGHCCFTHGDRRVGNGFREVEDICHVPATAYRAMGEKLAAASRRANGAVDVD